MLSGFCWLIHTEIFSLQNQSLTLFTTKIQKFNHENFFSGYL
jgi:hypothetical protein